MTFGNSVSTSNIFTRIVSYARSTFLTSRHLLPGNHHHHSDASLDRQLVTALTHLFGTVFTLVVRFHFLFSLLARFMT